MEDQLARMHPISLRFADAGLEQAFREEQARKLLQPYRAAAIALFLGVLVFWALLPDVLPPVADARGAIDIEGKGEMRTFLLSPPTTDIHVSLGEVA